LYTLWKKEEAQEDKEAQAEEETQEDAPSKKVKQQNNYF